VIGFLMRRLAWTVLLLLLVSTLTFLVFYVLPSTDPALLRAGRDPTPALIKEIRQNLGLNRPLYVQYGRFLKELVLHFNLGHSYQNNISVSTQIAQRVPATVSLVLGAVVIWLLGGVAVGTISAVKPRTVLAQALMSGALVFISTPVYWLGLVGLYLFASDIGIVPIFHGAGSYTPISQSFTGWLASLLLPWIVLAATYAAIYARFVRSSLSEVLEEDYIRTARAKGLSGPVVVVRHGLRAALTPVVSLLALDVGSLLGGVILVESVFNIPGIGRLGFDAIQNGDQPMIQGMALLGAFFIIFANLLADITYQLLDPRLRQ
jgi:peptide/nickel transport system permease protein